MQVGIFNGAHQTYGIADAVYANGKPPTRAQCLACRFSRLRGASFYIRHVLKLEKHQKLRDVGFGTEGALTT